MKMLERYTESERTNHWIVALTFVLAALSGLAFFHPAFYFFSNLFGGGSWTRILHPFIGLAMFVAFLVMARHHWADNRMNDADREWAKKARDLLAGRHPQMPPAGKFNAGQKRLFMVLVVSMAVMLVSGVAIWRPWFAPYLSITLLRVAVLLHSIAATVMILAIIGHIYMSIWVSGAVRAMTRGKVSESWAKMHHPAWLQEVSRK